MKSCLMFLGACMAGLVLAPAAPRADEPVLRIAKQGSMEAGGKMIDCATNDGGDPNSKRWPPGHVVVDNVYATCQYPADRRYPYPIPFNSGGGHTMALEKNNKQIMYRMIAWLEGNVFNPK